MTLHPKNEWIIPEKTVRVARAAFPKGNVYMMMRDQLGQLYYDQDFPTLFRADYRLCRVSGRHVRDLLRLLNGWIMEESV